MTKPELVDIIAAKAQTTNKTAEAMLNVPLYGIPRIGTYTEAIMEALSQGLNVQLIGFGTFEVKLRKARKGRNPQTGDLTPQPPAPSPLSTKWRGGRG
jgi:DNA-binding protein HU-beta